MAKEARKFLRRCEKRWGYSVDKHMTIKHLRRLLEQNEKPEADNAALKEQLQEHDDYYRKVVDDQCAPDEVHCTCVPALRAKIKELEEYEEAFFMSLEVALKKAFQEELGGECG